MIANSISVKKFLKKFTTKNFESKYIRPVHVKYNLYRNTLSVFSAISFSKIHEQTWILAQTLFVFEKGLCAWRSRTTLQLVHKDEYVARYLRNVNVNGYKYSKHFACTVFI